MSILRVYMKSYNQQNIKTLHLRVSRGFDGTLLVALLFFVCSQYTALLNPSHWRTVLTSFEVTSSELRGLPSKLVHLKNCLVPYQLLSCPICPYHTSFIARPCRYTSSIICPLAAKHNYSSQSSILSSRVCLSLLLFPHHV